MWEKKVCHSPTVSANSATFTLLRDLYKRGGRKGWWVLSCCCHFERCCFTAAEKKKALFARPAYRLKLSYVNDNVETLLSLQYRKIDDAVTSLLCPLKKRIQFLFCGMEKNAKLVHRCISAFLWACCMSCRARWNHFWRGQPWFGRTACTRLANQSRYMLCLVEPERLIS